MLSARKKFVFQAKVESCWAHLILNVAITQLQTHEVLVRLAQQLVEVEEGQLRTVAHQPRDRLVNAAHRLLRDRRVSMARRLVVTMRVRQY